MIALIDIDSLIYYSCKETLEESITSLDEKFDRIIQDTKVENYLAFVSPSRSKNFRRLLYSSYKEKRGKQDPPEHFQAVREYLIDKYNAIVLNHIEADDAVTLLKHKYGEEAIVCSPDKDVLKQVPGTHYNYRFTSDNGYNPVGFITTTEEDAKDFLHQQMLMGDSTDNIKGLPKIGEVKALTLLKGYKSEEDLNIVCVLKEYIKILGEDKGLLEFIKTFHLVYMLKNNDDNAFIENENLESLEPIKVSTSSIDEQISDDW